MNELSSLKINMQYQFFKALFNAENAIDLPAICFFAILLLSHAKITTVYQEEDCEWGGFLGTKAVFKHIFCTTSLSHC